MAALKLIAKEHILSQKDAHGVYEGIEGCTPNEKKLTVESREVELAKLPLLDDRKALHPLKQFDSSKIEDWFRVPISKITLGSAYYVLRITDDSMAPQFAQQDRVLVNLSRRAPQSLRKKVVAAWLDSDGAVVRVFQEDHLEKFWILKARNTLYGDIVIPKSQTGFYVAAVEAAWTNLI